MLRVLRLRMVIAVATISYCALLPVLVAQQKQATANSESPSVTLRATTHMVVLDVVVTNSSGHHAKSLEQGDFTITEDGVAQKIVSFEASGKQALARHERRDATMNSEPASGSPQTILVLDELNTDWVVNAQARKYLQKFFVTHGPRLEQPTALLALTNEGLEMICNYTRDAQTLDVALGRHRTALPYHIMNAEGVQGGYDRLGISLTAMYQIAQASTDHQSRKNLVWIGEGIPVLNLAVAQTTLGSSALDHGAQEKARQLVRRLANSLLEARISVYTVNPLGLIYTSDIRDPRILTTEGELIFENIAPETGGKIFRNLNDVAFLVDKSVRDGSRYYTLAYYPSNRDWNGRFREIKVSVNHPGLEARTRLGYYAMAEPEETPDSEIDLALSVAVRNPVPYTLIPVTITSKRLDKPAHTSQIMVTLDRGALEWSKLPNGDLRAEITLLTASLRDDNRVLKYKVHEFESVVSKNKVAELANVPVVFTVEADVPPKSAHIRCVVRDAQTEHMGTADLSLNEIVSSDKPGSAVQ